MANPSGLSRPRVLAPSGPKLPPTAFLSYAHADSETAIALRDALKGAGIDILIDIDHLNPGENIVDFARRCVRTADATIWLVSSHSLSSSWVVFEAMTTLQMEQAQAALRLIPCATDGAFLGERLRIDVTESIDARRKELDALIPTYLDRGLDLTDVSSERNRLLSMRSNLGEVLARLRDGFTVMLSPDTLGQSAVRVAEYLARLCGRGTAKRDLRDIRARADELRQHLWEGRTDDALDRLFDFVHDFSSVAKHVRDATVIANTLRHIDRMVKEGRVTFSDAEDRRQPAIYKFLELIDDIEVAPALPAAS